jgi:hypothetical protein
MQNNSDNKQPQEQQPQQLPEKLTLEFVPYNHKFAIIAGSFAQVLRGLQEMASRSSSDKETDDYKKSLYPKLRDIANQVVTKGCELFKTTSDKDKQVRVINLFGYNGMVKRDRNFRYPYVEKLRPSTSYEYANFGDYMKVLKQRCEFITTRSVPQRYVTDAEEGAAFQKLRTEVNTYLEWLKTGVDQLWSDAVKEARVAGGSQVKENLDKRVEFKKKQNFSKTKKVFQKKQQTFTETK